MVYVGAGAVDTAVMPARCTVECPTVDAAWCGYTRTHQCRGLSTVTHNRTERFITERTPRVPQLPLSVNYIAQSCCALSRHVAHLVTSVTNCMSSPARGTGVPRRSRNTPVRRHDSAAIILLAPTVCTGSTLVV